MDSQEHVSTVSELNSQVQRLLSRTVAPCWLRGEIGNLTVHSSGHVYLTLKDASSQINAVFLRGANIFRQLNLQTGQEIEAYGKVDIYLPSGNYQFRVSQVRPLGLGALQQQYEALKLRLQAEGLFDPMRKRLLPAMPRRIGLITSLQGAAIGDFLKILRRRHPNVTVRIINAPMQGEGAGHYVAASLRYFNRNQACDVIVVTRGGGSKEDLWEFNSEELVRAIAESEIPVLTAVGHERDFSLCDYAADFSCKTPSEAAEMVIGAETEIRNRLQNASRRLLASAQLLLAPRQRRLDLAAASPFLKQPQEYLDRLEQRLDNLCERLRHSLPLLAANKSRRLQDIAVSLLPALRRAYDSRASRLLVCQRSLNALNPRQVLSRGYAILRQDNGTIVRQARQVQPGEHLQALLVDSEMDLQRLPK